jgi:hypothetical protein
VGIRIERHPSGMRLFLAGLRFHHGLTGCLLALTGLFLAWHDRKDLKGWISFKACPPEARAPSPRGARK